MPAPDTRAATGHALLTAAASSLCLVFASALNLEHGDLAVWTTFLVMAQYAFTSFQKGVERIVGRGVGILAGLVLTTWFNETPLFTLGVMGVLLTAFFYLYFAGRFAYTFLQAGLYLVAVFQIGHAAPDVVLPEAKELFAAIVLGVVVADVVNWLAGVEGDVRISVEGAPLRPLRVDWLSQSLMLAVTVLLTLLGARDRLADFASSDFRHAADGHSTLAGPDSKRRTADRRPGVGRDLGCRHFLAGGIAALLSIAHRSAVPGHLRRDLLDSDRWDVFVRRPADGACAADDRGGPTE